MVKKFKDLIIFKSICTNSDFSLASYFSSGFCHNPGSVVRLFRLKRFYMAIGTGVHPFQKKPICNRTLP